ncbi:hypothetical protein EMPS_07064 [Entomortierella parvispora]|uniref:C-CAP/cofactor C-like domain-containing protein n=1 Tax=Entomortierella parvispora TaxID=205924 RepID=A0A9P3HDE8_9FUNG|nr:hypothetical protein EMPS_07064 [Entomortierella parvispora]
MKKINPENDLQSSIAPERRDIERCLEGLSRVPKDKVLDRVNELNQRINGLQNLVKEQIPTQPSSIIRVCTLEVRALADQLNVLRAQLVPKPKFRFKARAMLTSNASSSANPSSNTTEPDSPSNLTVAKTDSSMAVDDTSSRLVFNGQTDTHLSIDLYPTPSPMDISPPSSPLRSVRDVHLTHLTGCTVNLIPGSISLGNIYVKNLKRCLVVVPPITGNILLHGCVGSTLFGACHEVNESRKRQRRY